MHPTTKTLTLRKPAKLTRGGAVIKPRPIPTVPASVEQRRYERPTVDARCFWFCWCLDSSAPRVRHATFEDGLKELKRLQALAPEKTFVLYRALAVAGLP
jgi:hypothetical protein